MPAKYLFAGLAAVVGCVMAAPAWSADAPIPPPAASAPPAAAQAPAPAQTAQPASPPSDNGAKEQPAAPDKQEPAPQAATPAPETKPDTAAKPDTKPAELPADAASKVAKPPSVTVIDSVDAHGILGRDVRSPANENMGRIADVIVDRSGQVRAAVIDFGGFLGVGSRKIVVEWNALHFWNVADKTASITLDLTREQVRAAPEYKDDAPIVVLGASGTLSPLRFQPLSMQEH